MRVLVFLNGKKFTEFTNNYTVLDILYNATGYTLKNKQYTELSINDIALCIQEVATNSAYKANTDALTVLKELTVMLMYERSVMDNVSFKFTIKYNE